MPRAATAPFVPAYTVADLSYDDVAHRSFLPNGQEVPHVTSVLSATGLSTDFEELAAFGPQFASRIDYARALGTAVHADCHSYDDGAIDFERVDERVLPFLEAWMRCRQDKDLVPVHGARERRVYHPVYSYTGIPDGVFMSGQKRILPDLKTGDPESAAAHLQTAAYEAAWTFAHPDQPIDERWAIQLTPGHRVPYRITNYTARETAYMDFAKFQAALCVYHEQPSRRRRA